MNFKAIATLLALLPDAKGARERTVDRRIQPRVQ